MSKDKKYAFRDAEGLLDPFDKGTRSNFIRKAVKTQLLINQEVYNEEIKETNELITFYNDKLTIYEEELQQLNQQTINIKQQKRKTEQKLEKTMKEQNTRKTILQQQKHLKNKENLTITRQKIIDTILNNLLKRKNDKTVQQVNINYLVEKGEYDNLLELKKDLNSHIEKLKEHDTVNNQKIFKKDIEYLKKLSRSK